MFLSQDNKRFVAAWVIAIIVLIVSFGRSALAQGDKPRKETTNVIVEVREAEGDQPIYAARITLQFTEPGTPGRFGKSKKISYNAKTNAQGRYKFVEINKGTIVLMVTADGHQSYGKELQLENDNQVFVVRLKKPQPLL